MKPRTPLSPPLTTRWGGEMSLLDLLFSPMAQRSILVAALVGLVAPIVGTFLVQRRLSLLGDGIGHVALTGVGAGWLVGSLTGAAHADQYAVPGAIVAAVAGAVIIEYMRDRGKTSGDVALALLFYGGIAGGVLIISIAGGTSANLTGYLFGSLATVTAGDVWLTAGLSALIVIVGLRLRTALFAVSYDEEFARASGLPVVALNILIAVVAALTVTTSMRVVGLLLVSALMIVPVVTAQIFARSFISTMWLAMVIGGIVTLAGLLITFVYPAPPGATIVVLAITLFGVISGVHSRLRRRKVTSAHLLSVQESR